MTETRISMHSPETLKYLVHKGCQILLVCFIKFLLTISEFLHLLVILAFQIILSLCVESSAGTLSFQFWRCILNY